MKKLTRFSLILFGVLVLLMIVNKPIAYAVQPINNATNNTNGLAAIEARVTQLEANFYNLINNILKTINTDITDLKARVTRLEQSGGGSETSPGPDYNVEILKCSNPGWPGTNITLRATRVSDNMDISNLLEIIGITSNTTTANVGSTLIFPVQLGEGTAVNMEVYWRGTTKPLSYIITQAGCP